MAYSSGVNDAAEDDGDGRRLREWLVVIYRRSDTPRKDRKCSRSHQRLP